MEAFLERLLEEREQLKEKTVALEAFIQSDKFGKINERQRSLLKIQLPSMWSYLECLDQRIKLLT